MTLSVRTAFGNPFLAANDILNRFNLTLAARLSLSSLRCLFKGYVLPVSMPKPGL